MLGTDVAPFDGRSVRVSEPHPHPEDEERKGEETAADDKERNESDDSLEDERIHAISRDEGGLRRRNIA